MQESEKIQGSIEISFDNKSKETKVRIIDRKRIKKKTMNDLIMGKLSGGRI